MASHVRANFFGRGPRGRGDPTAPGLCGSEDLEPGSTELPSSVGRLVLVARVSLGACWTDSPGCPVHKTFVTSARQSSINSSSQYPGRLKPPRGTNHGFLGRDCSQ